MTDIATDRARIEQEVGSRTLIDVLTDTVAAHADLPAYSDKHHVPEGESWRTYTWTDVRERGLDVAAGLIGLGAQVGDTVAIMATNRIEHYIADIGGVHAALTPCRSTTRSPPSRWRTSRASPRRSSPCWRAPTSWPAGPGRWKRATPSTS